MDLLPNYSQMGEPELMFAQLARVISELQYLGIP